MNPLTSAFHAYQPPVRVSSSRVAQEALLQPFPDAVASLKGLSLLFPYREMAVHDLIAKAAQYNEDHHITAEQLDVVKGILSQCCRTATESELHLLLKRINAHPSSITYDLTIVVARQMCDHNPHLSRYFQVIHDRRDRLLVNVAGMEHFLEANGLPLVVAHIDGLADQVSYFLKAEQSTGVCVVQWDPQLVSGHYALVYMEKDDHGELRAFIADSMGWHKNPHGFIYAEQVKEGLTPFTTQIDYIEETRQKSAYGCSAFVVHDMWVLMGLSDVFAPFDPVPFMPVLQSSTLLDESDDSSDDTNFSHFVPVAGGVQNKYPDWITCKMFEFVVGDLLGAEQPTFALENVGKQAQKGDKDE